jgi:tRNA G18 (ribose-2'-O)-methylase SpoU
MGAHFHMPAMACTWEALDAFRARASIALWGADAGGRTLETLSPPDRLALLVGNEGAGLSQEGRARADLIAALPISTAVESLNVAVATGIFLYQLRP